MPCRRRPQERPSGIEIGPSLGGVEQHAEHRQQAHEDDSKEAEHRQGVESQGRSDKADQDIRRGTERKRPERLAYTWQWEGDNTGMPAIETLIEVELASKDDASTKMRVAARIFESRRAALAAA